MAKKAENLPTLPLNRQGWNWKYFRAIYIGSNEICRFMNQRMEKTILTPQDLAKRWSMSRRTVLNIPESELRRTRISQRCIRFRLVDVERHEAGLEPIEPGLGLSQPNGSIRPISKNMEPYRVT